MADSDPERDKDDETGAVAREEREDSAPRRAAARRRPLAEIDDPPERGPAAYLAEFIGTFGLVLFVCFVVILYAPGPQPATQPGLPETQPFQDWAVIGLVHAFILFVLIQVFAIVSGAHFNPAVTIALAAIRQIRGIDAAIYVAVQLIGGIAGAFVAKLMLDNDNANGEPKFGAPDVGQAAGSDVAVAVGAEVIGTFILVLAIVGVAVNPRGVKDWAGFAIGAALGAAVMIMGPLSGAGLNPARSFGPSLIGEFADVNAFQWILIYIVGPLLGALLAAFLYFQTVILPGRKGTEGMDPVG
jgi:glycerol uptake facilitator protein